MAPGGHKRPRPNGDEYSNRRSAPNPPPFNNVVSNPQSQYPQPGRGGRGGGRRGGPRGGARGGFNAPSHHGPPLNGVKNPASSEVLTPMQEELPSSGIQTPVPATPTPQAPAVQAPARSQRSAIPEKEPWRGFWPPKNEDHCLPFTYDYLTDEVTTTWQTSGRSALLESASQLVEAEDDLALSTLYQEIVSSVLTDRISATDGGTFVRDLISQAPEERAQDLSSSFLDTFSVLLHDVPTQERETREDRRKKYMQDLIQGTGISQDLMFEVLDPGVLVLAGIANPGFAQGSIKSATDRYYRQRGYNLLREDTEGYSKLITEYFTITNQAGGQATNQLVDETFVKIKALIGAFDLDLGRVIDMTLDVFANLLVKQYRFFVKFLRASSWWPVRIETPGFQQVDDSITGLPAWASPASQLWYPTPEEKEAFAILKHERDTEFWQRLADIGFDAFYELGGRRVIELEDAADPPALNADDLRYKKQLKYAQLDPLDWISTTGTFPPAGHRIASQVLGFKLSFYSESDDLPDNLIHLAALLIKIGFINLPDLYPHLVPDDSQMEAAKERMEKEKEERAEKKRPGAGSNALLKAGALTDDTVAPVPKIREPEIRSTPAVDATATDEAPEAKIPRNQKVLLLRALFAVGAIPDALFILGRFPWLMDLDPELPQYIHRILNFSLDVVYKTAYPVPSPETIKSGRDVISETHAKDLKTKPAAPRRSLRSFGLDGYKDGNDYRYYWDEWSDLMPTCQTIDHVFLLCNTLLNLDGVKIGQDPDLLYKLVRIGKYSLETDTSETNHLRWRTLAKRLLLPAMSLSESENPGLGNEMFQFLKSFPMDVRFNMYAEWFNGKTSRVNPDIKDAFELMKAQTRDVLKRISKTNVKQQARALGKCTWTSPGVTFKVIINQIQSYQNIIEVVVECGRYFSDLALDILAWSVLNELGSKGTDRLQGDGMLTSSWLKALSVFAGKLAQRQPLWNVTPILKYVAWQLGRGETADLEILQEIVANMGGINIDLNFPDDQIVALVSRPLLRNQTLKLFYDRRHELKNESKRLIRSLTDAHLAGKLLLLIAQERQLYMFRGENSAAPLKVLGSNLDKIHGAFVQFLEFLRANTSVEDFDQMVPQISALIGKFGLQPVIAFEIARPSLRKQLSLPEPKVEANGHAEPAENEATAAEATTDIEMKDADEQEEQAEVEEGKIAEAAQNVADANMDEISEVVKNEVKAVEEAATPAPDAAPTTTTTSTQDASLSPALVQVVQSLEGNMPEDFPQALNLSLFVRFWQFSLYDMQIAEDHYKAAIKKAKDDITTLNADRSDMSQDGLKRKEVKRKRLQQVQQELLDEQKQHIADYAATRKIFAREKDAWCEGAETPSDRVVLAYALLQECFIPRLLLSPADARYSALFLFVLHSYGPPGFHTYTFLAKLFDEKSLASVLYSCTQREADNLGRFLNEVLKTLRSWHASAKVYEKNALGKNSELPGFAIRIVPGRKPENFIGHADFQRLLYKWHISLNTVLTGCFTSGEYMRIRNGIGLLKHIVTSFPAITFQGRQMMQTLSELAEKDEREDVKTPALSLKADVKRMERHWVMPQAFRMAENNQAASDATDSATPKPESKAQLDASAPDFKPSTTSINGSSAQTTKPENEDDEEDGEIDDAKQALPATAEDKKAQDTSASQGSRLEERGRTQTPAASRDRPMPDAKSQSARPLPARAQELRPDSRPSSRMHSPQPPHDTSTRSESRHGTPSHRHEERRSDVSGPARPPVDTSLPPRPEGGFNPRDRHSRRDERSERNERPAETSRHDRRDERYGRLDRPQADEKYGRLDRPDDVPRESRSRPETTSSQTAANTSRPRSRSPSRAQQAQRDNRDLTSNLAHGPGRLQEDSTRPERPVPRQSLPSQDDRFERRDANVSEPRRSDRRNDRDRSNREPDAGRGPRSEAPASQTQQPPEPVDPPINAARAALIERIHRVDAPAESPNRAPLPDRPNMRGDRPGRQSLPSQDSRGGRHAAESHGPLRMDDQYHSTRLELQSTDRRGSHEVSQPRGLQTAEPDRSNAYVPPPMGPRSESHARVPSGGSLGSQSDLFNQRNSTRPSLDTTQGRLSSNDVPINPSRGQDPGRMQPPDAPAGPRGRGRGLRSLNTSEPPSPASHMPPDLQSPRDRMPPGGPMSDRITRPAPSSRTPSKSEHPGRTLLHDAPPSATPEVAVHPSRMNQIVNTPTQERPSPLANTNLPPMGPRASSRQGPPTPTSARAAGPQFPIEQPRGGDRRVANFQNAMQQNNSASDQGASIRGRASMGRLNSTDQTQPSVPSEMYNGRQDMSNDSRSDFPSRGEELRDRTGRPGPVDALAQEEGRRRQSSRDSSDRDRREQRDDRPHDSKRDERSSRSHRGEERSARGESHDRRSTREHEAGEPRGSERESRDSRRSDRNHEGSRDERDKDRHRERGDRGGERDRESRSSRDDRQHRSGNEHHERDMQQPSRTERAPLPPQELLGPSARGPSQRGAGGMRSISGQGGPNNFNSGLPPTPSNEFGSQQSFAGHQQGAGPPSRQSGPSFPEGGPGSRYANGPGGMSQGSGGPPDLMSRSNGRGPRGDERFGGERSSGGGGGRGDDGRKRGRPQPEMGGMPHPEGKRSRRGP